VLDAAQPGWGASGRNGGFACLGGTLYGAAALHRRFGAAAAAGLHRFQRAAVDQVAANLAEYGIAADPGPTGELCRAHRPAAMADLGDEADFLNRTYGLGVEILTREGLAERGLGPAGFAGGTLTPVGFPLNPMAYVAGLARAAAARGVAIHGRSRVTGMTAEGGVWRLTTAAGQPARPPGDPGDERLCRSGAGGCRGGPAGAQFDPGDTAADPGRGSGAELAVARDGL